MEPTLSVYGLVLGAAALALWLDTRLGEHRPGTLGSQMTHGFLAVVAVNVCASLVVRLAGPGAPPASRFAALLLILVPCLVYAFLAGLWLLHSLVGVVRRHSP